MTSSGGHVEEEPMSTATLDVTVVEVTPDEGRALFEAAVRHELGVSGEEFLHRLNADDIPDDWAPESVSRLEILVPFAA